MEVNDEAATSNEFLENYAAEEFVNISTTIAKMNERQK